MYMNAKYLFIIATGVTLLNSCYLLPTNPKNTVENFLAAVRDNNEQRKEFGCHPTDTSENLDLDLEVKNWNITSQEEKTLEHDPDSKYFEVSAKVEYVSREATVTRTLFFNVWESDMLFESNKRLFDKTDRLIEKSNQTINKVRQALGESQIEPKRIPEKLFDRSQISSKRYCITTIKAFEF